MIAMGTLDTLQPNRGRIVSVGLGVLQAAIATSLAFVGLHKLIGIQQDAIARFTRLNVGPWFRYFLGALKVAGAIGLLVPRMSTIMVIELVCIAVGAVVLYLFRSTPAEVPEVKSATVNLVCAQTVRGAARVARSARIARRDRTRRSARR